MKLKQQIILLTSLALVLPALLIGTVSIYRIQKKTSADIEIFRDDELAKLKLYLKHITDVGYGVIEAEHKEAQRITSGDSVQQISEARIMEDCLAQLSQIRFDKGEGYFWVTDNKLPFPTMLMHAEKVNLKGQVLNDPKYNVEKSQSRNIYQVRAELANANGEAYVEYVMKKPGTDEVDNKISYSRLYKPLGWIISTGFYTDQIEEAIVRKKEALNKQIRGIILFIVGIGIVVLGIGLGVSFHFSKKLTDAVVLINEKLKELAEGRQVDQVNTERKDEVGGMTHSLNLLVNGLKAYTAFAKEIGNGNLGQAFQPLSEEDVLGNELLVMRDNLNKAEVEKNLRDWTNEGLAKLGDVMRRNNSEIKTLANEALWELVKYLKANQGGFFIADSAQATLDLVATYAYGKKKFINKKINYGEGLVGQCALERDTIYLKDVPGDYIRITSGLGEALPRNLVLVPLIHNEKIYGILEIASFKVFGTHEITFIEKIAENLAGTIATVLVNENTKTLLEQSQQMSEEMKAQEEEMRQNMEELSATQEQIARQMADNKKTQDNLQVHEEVFSIDNILSEIDLQGNILMVNDKFCMVSKYHREELIGKPDSIIRHPEMPKKLFDLLWDTIKKGQVYKGIIKSRAKDGGHYWIDATIMPVKDENGKIVKYVGSGYHLTEDNIAVELFNRKAKQLDFPLHEQVLVS